MKTTKEGFLMNTLRRIPRHMVKALAAGAVLIAASLPLAVASTAGAAGTDLTGATVAFNVATGGGTTNTASFGTWASGVLNVTGATSLVDDGGTVTVTTNAPGVTFSSAAESSTSALSAKFASTGATVPGTYSLTVTDDGGTSTLAGAFVVNSAPTVTSVSPAVIPQQNPASATAVPVTITGTGFTNNAAAAPVIATSTVNGTKLVVAGYHFVSATSITVNVTPVNATNNALAATPGGYAITVINADAGSVTATGLFSISAYGVTNVSPSALPLGVATPGTSTSVTITGAGFESGAAVTLGGACPAGVTVVAGSTVATSATTITAVINNQYTTNTGVLCDVTVANPSVAQGGNGAVYTTAGALGIDEASAVAPIVTATSATTALVPGAAASVVTLTGTGFSLYSTAVAYSGTTSTPTSGVTMTNTGSDAGTSASFLVSVSASGASAGPSSVIVTNTNGATHYASNQFAAAFSVAGPQISSMAPAAIATTTPIGTVITLTGTGFTNTTTGTVHDTAGGALQGVFSYVSATTMNFVITAKANAADESTTAPTTLQLTQISASGTVLSNLFPVTVDAPPVIGGITYAVGTGVGVGATAQKVTITGTGFAAGATVGTFVNGSGVADPNVKATVTSVNAAGTAISATIAITAPDTNIAVGYTVTNTDGGVGTTSAIGFPLVIQAGPTITAVAPAAATASATNAFTITGTGFGAGAVVTANNNGGTCGTATVVSSTSITVSCTLGAAGTSAISLVVTNANGGSATSTAVLAAQTAPVVTGPFSKGTVGHARVGHTETVLIKGGGFFGQPTIRSNAKGFVKGIVSADSGTLMAIRVTVKANGATGEHTLTIILANGKSCKVNYATTK